MDSSSTPIDIPIAKLPRASTEMDACLKPIFTSSRSLTTNGGCEEKNTPGKNAMARGYLSCL